MKKLQGNNSMKKKEKKIVKANKMKVYKNFQRGVSGLLCATMVTLGCGGQGICFFDQTEAKAATTVLDPRDDGSYCDMKQDVATINITTASGSAVSGAMKKGDDYLAIADFEMKNADGSTRLDVMEDLSTEQAEVKFKVRGNTTAKSAKKPYNIKFDKRQALFDGLKDDKAKKYCLIANKFDPTLMRNYIALKLAKQIGLDYTCECEYVDLTVDGKFMGSYLLTEAVEVDKNRVDIDTANGDFLIQFERERNETAEGVNYIALDAYGTLAKNRNYRFAAIDPEIPTADERNVLENIKSVINIGDYTEVSKVIDVDSFVKMYVLNEFMKEIDANYSSVYFYYKNSEGKLYAGPVWDYDLSSGNAGGYYKNEGYFQGVNQNDSTTGLWADRIWYNGVDGLKQHAWFNTMINKYYAQYHDNFVNVYKAGGMMDQLVAKYRRSFAMNYLKSELGGAGWDFSIEQEWSTTENKWVDMVGMAYPKSTFAANVEELRTWFTKRVAYLDTAFELPVNAIDYTEYEKVKAAALELDPTDYTNYDVVQAALNRDVTSEEITQEDVDAAAVAITEAIDSLIKRQFTTISGFTFKDGIAGGKIEEREDNIYTTSTGAITSGASLACYAGPANDGKYRSLKWSKAEYIVGDVTDAVVPILTPKDTNDWGSEGEVYFQIETSTSGYEEACFDATLAATKKGPKSFKLMYSLDGKEYKDISGSTKELSNNKEMQQLYKNFALPKEAQNQRKVYLRIVVASTETVGGTTEFFDQSSGEIAINQICIKAAKVLPIDRTAYEEAVERAGSVKKEAYWKAEVLDAAMRIDVSGEDVTQFELDEATYAINNAVDLMEKNPRKAYSYYVDLCNGDGGKYYTYYEGNKFELPKVTTGDSIFVGWSIMIWDEILNTMKEDHMYVEGELPEDGKTTYYYAKWEGVKQEIATPGPTPTAEPTIIPKPTISIVYDTPEPTMAATATPTAIVTPTVEPTATATVEPTAEPTAIPTDVPPTATPVVASPEPTVQVATSAGILTLKMRATYKQPVAKKAPKQVKKSEPKQITLYTTAIKTAQFNVDAYVDDVLTKADDIVWSSSNTKVATVKSSGLVTAKKAGSTVITASAGGQEVSCKVIVKRAVIGVKNASKVAKLKKGSKIVIRMTATPDGKYTFRSSNKKVVSVTPKGLVRAIRKGKAKITVSCNGMKTNITIRVR